MSITAIISYSIHTGTDESHAVMVSTPSLLSLHHDGGTATTALPESAQVKGIIMFYKFQVDYNGT